ncbi:hypothetical protein SCHPADRAFT_945466 [Schizopora paradoxa]|uniref:BTB domain-containing protein n=1 Tax=Schizopora paradoxa TaxID=27342 RepID=A0A0H2R780_9AGAM|nr:hypothetical protein SCHPADRAFT_945466 [Schizopora paradoxa]
MPPKRRAANETSSTKKAKRKKSKPSGPPPHDKLWFSDGSIVLETDVHLYRVHKSMLAKYSTVLSDMFEIPSGDSNSDCWEDSDVPIVKMVGDKDDEVCVLLEALYDRNFGDTLHELEIPALTSLLSISTKYDFQDIQADVMQFLLTRFPNKLEDFVKTRNLWNSYDIDEVFALLVVAHRSDALKILPALYYLCARFPLETILDYLPTLPPDCMRSLLLGRDWLYEVAHRITQRSILSMQVGVQSRTDVTMQCSEKLRARLSESSITLVFDMPDRGILEGVNVKHSGICNGCTDRYIGLLGRLKAFYWDHLPQKFLNKNWKELNRT